MQNYDDYNDSNNNKVIMTNKVHPFVGETKRKIMENIFLME
jgi:hypothetical protein